MPENNCAVSRNASHTSLLPSVQKLWQFAQHTDARCRHYWWTATPPVQRIVWKFLPVRYLCSFKNRGFECAAGIQSESGQKCRSIFGVILISMFPTVLYPGLL